MLCAVWRTALHTPAVSANATLTLLILHFNRSARNLRENVTVLYL